MARQSSVIQFEGSVGTLTFYKTQDGYLVRRKGGVSGNRIKSSLAYARTRQNMAEFGRAGKASKLFRRAFKGTIDRGADSRVASRLTGMFVKVLQEDPIHSRGERKVEDGRLQLLEGFEFNQHASLNRIVQVHFEVTLDRVAGRIAVDLPSFSPSNTIERPDGATHFRFVAAGGVIDFASGDFDVATSESKPFQLSDGEIEPLQLIQSIKPDSRGGLFVLLGIEFLQSVNWEVNVMRNSQFNALAVVGVE